MPQELTDGERFPILDQNGQQMLQRLRQHPHAPRYNYHCGEKLSKAGLERVRAFAERLSRQPSSWKRDAYPDWLATYIDMCQRDVPFYRRRDEDRYRQEPGAVLLADLPFTDRHDLRREPWSFVPDSADIHDLIVYSTSGTTGNLVKVVCDPTVPVSYLPLFELALSAHGVSIAGGSRVSIVHVAAQRSTYTLTSVMSYFDFAGFAKVNLIPDEWNQPGDRKAFLDDCSAEVYTGDPFALVELAKLDLQTKPKAILSSATTLLPAVRRQLATRFECPVIDVVSMNESGPIAFSCGDSYRLFPHELFAEIVDPQGQVVAEGEFGEIVLTGGINPFLPLLRYRTGDHGRLSFVDGHPVLLDFTGRTPVHYFRHDGEIVRSIDVIVALYHTPLPLFRLHQRAGGGLLFQTRCDAETEDEIRQRLQELFGKETTLDVEQLPLETAWQGKSLQFTSDLEQE